MNADRYLSALPTWVLLAATFMVMLMIPTPGATPQPVEPNYHAQAEAIIKAEIARESRGQHCGQVVRVTAAFPQRLLVSRVVGGLEATSVESMTYDDAMREAMAGRVTIRCAII